MNKNPMNTTLPTFGLKKNKNPISTVIPKFEPKKNKNPIYPVELKLNEQTPPYQLLGRSRMII